MSREPKKAPDLEVFLLPNSKNGSDVPKVIEAAKKFWKPTAKYWPQPRVTELDKCWYVTFKIRNPALDFHGVKCIRVEKVDLSCSFVPLR